MATYQKRGYKKTIEVEEEVIVENNEAIEAESTTAEVFDTLDETANKSEKWIENNSKVLFISLIAIVALIFGYMGYSQFIEAPKEKTAIIDAYNFFADWASSGGSSYIDWYLDKPGYRNNANLKN